MTREICGDCDHFDRNGVDGTPFGEKKIGDTKVRIGVCRARLGLAHGLKTEGSKCTQEPGTFKRKNA